jgi:hypothetical protein
LNPSPQEAQLEDQKDEKSLRRSSRRRKPTKSNKRHEKRQNHEKSKKSSKLKQKLKINTPLKSTPANTLNASSPHLIVVYHVSSLNHPVSKEFNQLCAHTLSLWQ